MSAIATPAATPPRAAAPEGGRLKRKAKVPERFQSPPPAKRVRVQPPVRAKKPGNGEKHVEKHVAAKRAGKGGKPPRAPAQRHQAYAPVPPADTGVNAMALGIGLYLAPVGNRLWRHCSARHMDPIAADRMRLPAAAHLVWV